MKKKLFLGILSALVGITTVFALCVSPNEIKQAASQQHTYTFALDSTNIGFLPTSAGSGQSDNSNSPRTTNGNPIVFSYELCRQVSQRIRFNTNGSLSNQTPFTGLKAVTVNFYNYNNNVTLSYGSSTSNYSSPITITNGVRYEINSMPYFKLKCTTSYAYITSITVEYLCDSTGELDPVSEHVHHGYHYLATAPTADRAGNKEFYACSECQYVSLVLDSGVYTDAILTYELPSDHIAYIAPTLLQQPTQFDYPIPVNLVVPSTGYEVDQTGNSDASTTIQSALDYVGGLGGGTVFIPGGKYKLANQLRIPNRVTLVGDFKGTDASNYGTVFLCTKTHDGTSSISNNAQIIVDSNASINGITFYYPNQNIASVTRYGYTIYALHNLTATLSNLFFINSYDGISVNAATEGAGELVNLENIYGTFLHNGVSGYYQSDVGFWSNIHISPSYYENALSGYRCSNSSLLYKYTRTNLTAMILSDLDDFSFNKIYIDNANVGIHFPSEVNRPLQAFWGILNDVHISECLTGVYATKIFNGGAAVFTHSELGKVLNNSNTGMIKLSKCSYDDLLGNGTTLIEEDAETYEAAPSYDDTNEYDIPNRIYYINDLDDTGVTDVSAALQTKIDECQNGGVIVLKNGTYRLDNPITVPSHTLLTSFSNSYTRTTPTEAKNYLVKFVSYSSDSCVKLSSFAGINGIRIANVYKDPDTASSVLSSSGSDSYVAVKGIGNNCFAINTEASYTFTGFDFSSVSDHYIKYCYGSAYNTFIKVGNSGKVINAVSNLSFVGRSCISSFAQANVTALDKYSNLESSSKTEQFNFVVNLTRTYCTMIKISGGTELALNCFSYGVKTLIQSSSASLLAITTSQDNLKDDSYMYVINGGTAKIVNTLRVFGKSYNLISGQLEIYGRLDFNNKYEKYYNSQTSGSDTSMSPLYGLAEDVLTYCEGSDSTSNLYKVTDKVYQGSYSYRANSSSNPSMMFYFSNKDISNYMASGYIRFYLYINSLSNKGTENTLELTSGGACDVDEITIDIGNQIKAAGWNEIVVKLSDMNAGPGTFNPQAMNYLRVYALNCGAYYYIDYISFFYKQSSGSNPLLINNCESTSSTNGVHLSGYRAEGSYSFAPNDAVNAVFACSFSAKNVSSYMSTGALSFYLYVPDRDLVGDYVFVELTSGGNCDIQEITCSVKEYITEDGWCHIEIPLSNFYKGSDNGTFNPSSCNFFRLYTLNSSCDLYLDDIKLVK